MCLQKLPLLLLLLLLLLYADGDGFALSLKLFDQIVTCLYDSCMIVIVYGHSS